MKYILLIVALTFSTCVLALEASVDTYVFEEGEKTYLETYIRILNEKVTFLFDESDQTYSSAVEIVLIIKQADKVIHFEKYQLNSPKTDKEMDYLDLKRFVLPSGNYSLSVEISDIEKPENTFGIEKQIHIDNQKGKLHYSDVLLLAEEQPDPDHLSPLTRNGVYMEPIAFNFSDEEDNDLFFYAELYNSILHIKETSFYIKYAIVSGYAGENGADVLMKYKKVNPSKTMPLLLHFDISKLTSGNYHLLMEAYNNRKELLTSVRTDFVKRNPAADLAELEQYNETLDNSFVNQIPADKLDFHLKSLLPIIDSKHHSTHEYVIKKGTDRSKRSFIWKFWTQQTPDAPELGFAKYAQVAEAVHLRFYNTVGYGFETDRGYIYLKYGKPDDVLAVEDEPNTPPYQIWLYHFVPRTNQSHVKFLFFNQSLVTNDFELLHSTCRGEIQNEAWEILLYHNAPEERLGNSIDGTSVGDNWVRRAKKHFNDF